MASDEEKETPWSTQFEKEAEEPDIEVIGESSDVETGLGKTGSTGQKEAGAGSEKDEEDVKHEEQEIVSELEHEVDELETEFSQVKSDSAPETVREKQEMVEEILKEVHDQIDFLREISEKE